MTLTGINKSNFKKILRARNVLHILRDNTEQTNPHDPQPRHPPLHNPTPPIHTGWSKSRTLGALWRIYLHLSYGATCSYVQDRHEIVCFFFFKPGITLLVCLNPLKSFKTCLQLQTRVSLPETLCSLCCRIVYCTDDLFQSRYTKKNKYIEQQNQQQFTRRDSGWAKTWLTTCK